MLVLAVFAMGFVCAENSNVSSSSENGFNNFLLNGDNKFSDANGREKFDSHFTIVVNANKTINGVLETSVQNPISNANITYFINDKPFNITTDDNGKFTIPASDNDNVTIYYYGSGDIHGTGLTLKLDFD